MQITKACKGVWTGLLVFLLAVALVFTMMPLSDRSVSYAETNGFPVTGTPVVAVTGTGLIGGAYSNDTVSREKSYTLDDLKNMEGAVSGVKYSARKSESNGNRNLVYAIADGIPVETLLQNSGISVADVTDPVRIVATDNYASTFTKGLEYNIEDDSAQTPKPGLDEPRYYFEGFDAAKAVEVPAIISWAYDNDELEGNDPSVQLPMMPAKTIEKDFLKLFVGQYASPDDRNYPLFNGKNASKTINRVMVGDPIGKDNKKYVVTDPVLTVGSKGYTREDILLMDFVENSYTYAKGSGTKTDYVRGVSMETLLGDRDETDIVNFVSADGTAVNASGYTVKQLIDNDYVLAYEKGTGPSDLAGIYETGKDDPSAWGLFTLYGSDENGKPAKMINAITVTTASGTDFSNSPYKHITNGGKGGKGSPYNIDAITGATLTIEGPGVKKSVPESIRDLEGRDAGAVRANYTDRREGSNITRTYEGIDLYYILHNMTSGDNGIQLTDTAKNVFIKNRNRRTIAAFTLDQIEEAHNTETPIIVAYGTGYTDGSKATPFVFNNGEEADPDLGNEDGCVKLVYDKASITGDVNAAYTEFGNMAYIYVAEEEAPGYKHDKDPYQSPDISNYVLTITGDKIGREVNYTVKQLEDMVAYDSEGKPDNTGMGYRDEYSLANSNYWYVNEYEGVQLWKLLLKSGLDPALAADEETMVSSTATDGYLATDKYTIKQVADPNSFGFYEKNPNDNNDGTYDGNDSIREGDDVTTGDKLKAGYPVLVAYGVNGYPYVEKATQEGFLSGLENDGGPLRIISGKMNYKHANGSNQAKYVEKVVVGDGTNHYSTHKYHSKEAYTALADSPLQVTVLNGTEADAGVLMEQAYNVGDIEALVYGDRTGNQVKSAKVKAAYGVTKKGTVYSDLYEGVSLPYFLTDVVELPGYKGTITFSNGSETVTMDLEAVLKQTGSNAKTGVEGLVPVLAYGKNGAPLVASGESEGYESEVKLAEGTEFENTIEVKNSGGPLQLTFPTMENSDLSEKTVKGITSITINLLPDKYAHTNAPYDAYKDQKVTIFGAGTKLTEPKEFSVLELESKQKLAFTGDYSILKDGSQTATESRYRGINLYSLLTSTAVGLKTNADIVKVTTTDDETVEIPLADIRAKYKNTVTGATDLPVILAYGSGKAGGSDEEDGLPLVADKKSEGYDDAYGNSGGPIRLVVGQKDADDVNSGRNKKFVKSIEVTASEMESWNHSSSDVFKQYLSETINLTVVDQNENELFNKDYTVEEIEAQTDLVDRVEMKVSKTTNVWEGVDFWKFVTKDTKDIEGIEDPIKVETFANDGASRDLRASLHGMDSVINGAKDDSGAGFIPNLLAYAVDGLPLTTGNPKAQATFPNGEGFDDLVGNNGGPLRMAIHNGQGTALACVTKIKITVGETTEPVDEDTVFTIHGLKGGDVKLSMEDIKNMKNKAGDVVGAAEGEYVRKGVTKKVKGVLLKHVLANCGVETEGALITMHTPDGFENKEGNANAATYHNITLKQAIDQQYFLAYQEWDPEAGEWKDIEDTVKDTDTITNVRMYRNYCEANGLDNTIQWLDQCDNVSAITVEVPEITEFKEYPTGNVRSTYMDGNGTIWVGTYGGGLYYKKAGEDEFSVLNTESEPALKANASSAVAVDAEGGIWVSQNVSFMKPQENQGVLYIKDGEVTQYTSKDDPKTIPNDYVQAIKVGADGKVWFGSFGGLTIYDPAADTWTNYDKSNKEFPATSINTITLDDKGGAWLGFYPDGAGTKDDPYTGGFCYIDKDGNLGKTVVATGEMTSDERTSKLAQVWVRSIAIDQKGTVWVVASGTNIDENEGGTIWKYQASKDKLSTFTGDQLFGSYLDGSSTTEVRIVAVDGDGALWFGTSADGILKVEDAQLNADNGFNVAAQYAKETGSWSASNMNNVYSIDFWNDGTVYAGTAGGLLVLGDEPKAQDDPAVEPAGDATAETADLTITGDALSRDGYFTIRGIKNTEGIDRVDATFSWTKADETSGTSTVQGATIENILNYIGLAEDAEIESVEAVSADGETRTYTADQIFEEDLQGNKAMFIWTEDGGKVTKVIIGQFKEGEVNKGKWAKDVTKIIVHAKQPIDEDAVAKVTEAIDQLNEDVTLDDAEAIAAAREAYEALTDAEKAEIPKETLDKLEAAEQKLDEAITEAYVEQVEEMAAEIDYSLYDTTDKLNLWLAADRFKQEIAKAGSAEEAKAIYDEFQAKLAVTKTADQKLVEKLNMGQLNAKAAAASYNTVNISWEGIAGAEVYEIARGESPDGEFETVKTTAQESYKDTVKVTGKTYYYKVRAVAYTGENVKAEGDYCEPLAVKTSMAKPVIKKVRAAKKKATVTWKKVGGAEGYEIYRATKKSGKYVKVKTINKASTVKFVNKKLKKGKSYFYKIKAFNTVDGQKVYTGFSSVKKVKIKK